MENICEKCRHYLVSKVVLTDINQQSVQRKCLIWGKDLTPIELYRESYNDPKPEQNYVTECSHFEAKK